MVYTTYSWWFWGWFIIVLATLVGLEWDLSPTIEIAVLDDHRFVEWDVPSGYVKIAIENDPFIVDLPIKNGDFP